MHDERLPSAMDVADRPRIGNRSDSDTVESPAYHRWAGSDLPPTPIPALAEWEVNDRIALEADCPRVSLRQRGHVAEAPLHSRARDEMPAATVEPLDARAWAKRPHEALR